MVSVYQDLSLQFASNNGYVNIDTSQYDYVLVQIITPSATISFNSTNDGGAVTGGQDGSATSAQNWTSCFGTNQATNTTATSTASGNSIWKFAVVGRYLQLTAAAGTTIKSLLVMYTKIQ